MLHWKPRVVAVLATLSLTAAALVDGVLTSAGRLLHLYW
jgi:hypothetical protein